MIPKVLVCLSGGLDSATVLHMLLNGGWSCEAVAFDYDQPHRIELDYARRQADRASVPYRVIQLPKLPKIDNVVFGARNLLFASHALAIAVAEGFGAVALGCNQSDWERFPDCRPAFWDAVNEAARAYGLHILLPLLGMTKHEVVTHAHSLRLALAETWTCYSPRADNTPCGSCLACHTRTEAGA